MKVIVTGGAGFIGCELVSQLVKNEYEVLVIDSLTYAGDINRLKGIESLIEFKQIEICNLEAVKGVFEYFKPDYVAHLAAESHVDRSILNPSEFMMTNVLGTMNLLEVSKNYSVVKFLNMSTDEVYGELGETGQFSEETPLIPNSPYSVSKASADMLGRAYFRTFGIPVVTARPSNNYGAWQYPEKLIPVVILKALNNEKIPVYGTGNNIREWLYVEDCASALLKIMISGKSGEAYNIGSSNERTNLDVVKSILKILNKSDDLIEFIKDRPGHDFRYSLNYEKFINEFNWQPETSFDSGIEKTVNWYLDNLKWTDEKIGLLKTYWKTVYK